MENSLFSFLLKANNLICLATVLSSVNRKLYEFSGTESCYVCV